LPLDRRVGTFVAMTTNYNAIAGSELGRVSALSDGIFAFAMTVLVLEIRIPEPADIHSERELAAALIGLAPRAATWLLSLMTLGIFWTGQQTQLTRLTSMNRNLGWLHFVFLAVITALPFSTRLLAGFFDYRLAFLVYYANILLAGATLYIAWRYAERAGLTNENPPGPEADAIRRRIVRAQALYAIGALAGLVSTPLGVALIILIQLNYAIAPRWTDWS
jgi:uncharacterized membrane protein